MENTSNEDLSPGAGREVEIGRGSHSPISFIDAGHYPNRCPGGAVIGEALISETKASKDQTQRS